MPDRVPPSLRTLTQELTSGHLSRREFIARAAALGLSASAIAAVLAACGSASEAYSGRYPIMKAEIRRRGPGQEEAEGDEDCETKHWTGCLIRQNMAYA